MTIASCKWQFSSHKWKLLVTSGNCELQMAVASYKLQLSVISGNCQLEVSITSYEWQLTVKNGNVSCRKLIKECIFDGTYKPSYKIPNIKSKSKLIKL